MLTPLFALLLTVGSARADTQILSGSSCKGEISTAGRDATLVYGTLYVTGTTTWNYTCPILLLDKAATTMAVTGWIASSRPIPLTSRAR